MYVIIEIVFIENSFVMVKSVKIFDKVRGKLEPILVIDDMNLKVYHPNVLSKEVSLQIFDSQTMVDYLNDQISSKTEKINELRESKFLDEKNLADRKKLIKEISELNDQVDSEICKYVEALSKLKPGTLNDKLDDIEFTEDYSREKLITDIFSEINTALREHNEKEYGVKTGESNPT